MSAKNRHWQKNLQFTVSKICRQILTSPIASNLGPSHSDANYSREQFARTFA